MDAWSETENTIDFWHGDYCKTLRRGWQESRGEREKSFGPSGLRYSSDLVAETETEPLSLLEKKKNLFQSLFRIRKISTRTNRSEIYFLGRD